MIWPAHFVDQGCVRPRGYGLAWYTYEHPGAVCLPVPLNWLAGGFRRAWLALLLPFWARALAREEHDLICRWKVLDVHEAAYREHLLRTRITL